MFYTLEYLLVYCQIRGLSWLLMNFRQTKFQFQECTRVLKRYGIIYRNPIQKPHNLTTHVFYVLNYQKAQRNDSGFTLFQHFWIRILESMYFQNVNVLLSNVKFLTYYLRYKNPKVPELLMKAQKCRADFMLYGSLFMFTIIKHRLTT